MHVYGYVMLQYGKEAVSKALLCPQPPKGGSLNSLRVRKSPLGDLGANEPKDTYETAVYSTVI
jgi:hypothetical protein